MLKIKHTDFNAVMAILKSNKKVQLGFLRDEMKLKDTTAIKDCLRLMLRADIIKVAVSRYNQVFYSLK